MPAQPGKVGFGGVARFPAQAKKPEEVIIQNITTEIKEQIGQVQVNISPVDETIKYDSAIFEAFNNNSEIPVIIRLKDKSGITLTGTKEEQRLLSIQRDEWFKPVVEEFYASLSKNDFRGERGGSSLGFVGFITKNGFESLLNDSRVKSISWTKYDVYATLSESIPLINVDDVWSAGYNGSGIKVCVIDTGINSTHLDLIGKIKDEHCYCRTPGDGYGFCCLPDHSSQNDNATDDNGHGTHVIGIVASQDSTYKGVGKGVDVYVVKVLNSSGGGRPPLFWDDLGKAIDWCRINKSVDIISISIGDGGNYPGSEPCPDLVDQQINDAYNAGISVIIASGNKGYTNGISYPACSPNAISVGATTKSDAIWSLTNRGSNLDLLAPGAAIASLRWDPTKTLAGCNNINSEISVCSGTSMATPHISGVAALLLDLNNTLTPSQIETTLKNTGVNIGGFKRINASAALDAIRDKDSDNYFDQAYGGTDCNDNNGAVHPDATETCDGIDNDCDSIIDEGCVNQCTVSGYEQCFESTFGDCKARIAINRYENVNTIKWGAVSDSSDPYVVNEYKIGWKGDIAKKVYYGKKVNETCAYGGCNSSQEVVIQGTKVTVTAPGIAHQDETLGYNDTPSFACWTWFYNFTPNYGSTNPIYVLKCFADSDCASGSYCNKTGTWNQWACVTKYANGVSCAQDYQCQSNYCDNDGIGLTDDNWCFTPYNTYFDGQENTYCEYATDNGIADCDERQVNGSITSCTLADQTYLGDRCTSSCGSEDSNICRSSAFASGCTADTECDGIVAGTGYCNSTCKYNPPPPFIKILFPVNNAQYQSTTLDLNWTSNNTLASCYYKLNENNYNNVICKANNSYSGFSFSVSGQDTVPEDITRKGNNFYVLGRTDGLVFEYDSLGTYTGSSFSVYSQDNSPQGLTWNGSNFYVAGGATDSVYEYNPSGTYTGFSFSVTSQDTDPTAITHKDGSFFVLGASNQRVYQYNSAGVYTGFNFAVSSQDNVPEGIVWDEILFYVIGQGTDRVYEYYPTGSYTGFNFSVAGQDTGTRGITTNGSSLFVVGATTDKVYKYNSLEANLSNTTLSSLSIGKHNVTIYGKGSDGNTAQTNYTYFNITAPDTTPPSYSNLKTSPTSPATYQKNQQYQFNATWQDNSGINTALIEFNGINYTMSQNGNEYYQTFADLPVGNYDYYFWANDTLGNNNKTDLFTYTINKASSLVYTYLNNSRANATINVGTSIYLNGTLITGEGIIQLYNNGTLINSGISPLSNLTAFNNAGLYNITTVYPESQNYTSNFETWWVNATQALIPSLKIPSLTTLSTNNTLATFEFVILNNGTATVSNIQWQFDTDNNNVINSTINISTLLSNESAFVYVQHNFSSAGTYNVKANATGLSDSTIVAASLTSSVTINSTDVNKYLIKDNLGNNIAWFGDTGNIVIKGKLEQNSNFQRTDNFAFVIRNNANDVLIIENNGSMYIDGTLSENQGTIPINMDRNEFRLKWNGEFKTNVNESGYIFTKGTLTQNGNP